MSIHRLWFHIIKIAIHNLRCSYCEVGSLNTLQTIGIYLWALPMHLGLVLDRIFFPGYKKVKIVKPVFIIGTGRTGSTFLYRLLNSEHDYVSSQLWHILIPSLTMRVLLWPFINLILRKQANTNANEGHFEVVSEEEGHQTTLTTLEEDEMVLGYLMDTQHLSYAMPLGLSRDGFDYLVFNDDQPHRIAAAKFLKSYLQRQIKYLGRSQVISKAIFSTFRLRSLLEVFPDAKFIHLIRSPLESIPSHMTLHGKLSRKFNRGAPDKGVSRLMMSRYRYNCESLLHFESLREQGLIDETHFLEINYEDLRDNLELTMKKIIKFTGIKTSAKLRSKWAELARRQSSYQRKHTNLSLDDLGLSEQKVRHDLAPIFVKYGG